ncbi:polygalacturonase [Mycobacterium sp. BK558]|nr:polygalacturonase [Mycobacterium sp. BK558]
MDHRSCRVCGANAAAGIGLALSSGIAVAEPSDTETSSTGASTPTTAHHATSPKKDGATEKTSKRTRVNTGSDDESADAPRSARRDRIRNRDDARGAPIRSPRAEAASDDKPPAEAADSSNDDRVVNTVVAAPVTAEHRTVSAPRPQPTRPVEVVKRLLTRLGVTDAPSPAESPSVWAVLAWVRRQHDDSSTTAGAVGNHSSDSSGTNSTTLTGTTVDVRDFGAIGDGTTDDSAAIKAAEAALTSGGRLYFPDGDYRFAQQHPAGNAAVLLKGLSNVTVEFDPGARLLMDNFEANGHGTSHGIRVEGAASHVTILNPTIEWVTKPSARSFGDGLSVLGWPSDSPPPAGWTGSTGTVQYVTITNARVVNAPQTGAVIMGASDVTVTDFTAVGTMADGLHVNASRRVTIDRLTAIDNGDDGLAFVTYYHPTQLWTYGPTDGPFNQSTLGEWNNSGSTATHVTVSGGRASGVRVQGGRDITISDVTVSDKDFGVQVNSAKATGPGDWTSLASRDVDISDVTIADVTTGIVLATNNIDGTEDPMWWDFSGLSISDVAISNASNWSIAVETTATTTSAFAGVTLRNIHAETGAAPLGGGNGGILFASLRDSTVDGIHLVSDHAADINILGAAQIRGNTSVANLPPSNLTIDDVTLDGSGRILIQDIAGLAVGGVASSGADGAAVVLYRVRDASFANITAYLPGRGVGMGRGVQLLQLCDVDIADIAVTVDDHVGSDWWAVELGGGNPGDVAGDGVHVDNVTYVSGLDRTGSDIVVQGGPYGPVDWYIDAHWLHQGEAAPLWRSALLGDTSPV